MNIPGKNINSIRKSLRSPLLWTVFAVYVIVSAYGMYHHELWGDEIHAWNIAKSSHSFSDLLHNTRYEGHPPGWHTLLWMVSKATHNVAYMQVAQWVIAIGLVFVIVFLSPLPRTVRILIPFGYFFLFEYGLFSRNYAIGILPAFCICLVMYRHFKYKLVVYYALLLLMCYTHMLLVALAACLHLCFLLWNREQGKKIPVIVLHAVLGILVAVPSLYFIFPPSDSQINMSFWMHKSGMEQLALFAKAPAWAFVPVPAWWEFHFWNTQCMMMSGIAVLGKVIMPLVSVLILATLFALLRKSSKPFILFAAYLLFAGIIACVVFGLTYTRYTGFIYISFLVAYWLYCYDASTGRKYQWLINGILVVQLLAGVFAFVKDIRLPFSNAYRVKELLKAVPANGRVIADYWALNAVSAFADTSLYCVDTQKETSFISWQSGQGSNVNKYYNGITAFLQNKQQQHVYMISTITPAIIFNRDPKLPQFYQLELLYKIEGAIEPGGNLYLYLVRSIR
jgi:hypothetical protein